MLRICLSGAHACARHTARFALWTAWLLLALLLAAQVTVAVSNRLQVPDFVLRALERRLEASGMTVAFGQATFDPNGRILIENARLSLASYGEPVATARALYLKVDPWSLAAGRIEPAELRATGVNFLVPAMLSASGRPERIIRDLDAGLTQQRTGLSIDYLTGWLGPVAVRAHGSVHIAEAPPAAAGAGGGAGRGAAPMPTAALVASRYGEMIRELAASIQKISGLDSPRLEAVLTPSETRAAIVALTLTARGFDGGPALPVQADGLRAWTRMPLISGGPIMAVLGLSADGIQLPGRVSLHGVRMRVRGILDRAQPSFTLTEALGWAVEAVREDATLASPSVRVTPGAQAGHLSVEALGQLLGGTVLVSGDVDPRRGTATGFVHAQITPDVLNPVSERVGVNVRRFLDLSSPVDIAANVRVTDHWHFKDADGWVAASNPVICGVRLDHVAGPFTFDGRHFRTEGAVGTLGEDVAHGLFEQDFSNWDYRFVLEGRLRPLDISDWFADWWPGFFGGFDFPKAPPAANIDLRGCWATARPTQAFLYVDAGQPLIRGVPFDDVKTRIFLRPQFFDILECRVNAGSGSARAVATVTSDYDRGLWTGLDFTGTSTIDPATLARLLGPDEASLAAKVTSERAPSVRVSGHVDGPGAAEPGHRSISGDVAFDGGAAILGVPLRDVHAAVTVTDDDVTLTDVGAGFAGGTLKGSLRLAGRAPARTVAVTAQLNGASLGQAAAASASLMDPRNKAGGSPSLQAFAREKAAVKVDLSLTANETLGTPASLRGKGDVRLQGPELGSVYLLGGLSKLLKVTSLRFTNAQSSFTLDGTTVRFPDLAATGANSAIQARGSYDTGRHQLDFTAKILPFQESRSPLQLLTLLTAPLSAIFEVRLNGPVDKPTWTFAHGPHGLLNGGS